VQRDELEELHYITPIANLPSILENGILSHFRAQKREHISVAMQVIQDRRSSVVVPGGRPLHEYANLYICARNPMLFLRRGQHEELCVLQVSPDVLDLPGVVVVSGNASSGYVRFGPGPRGLAVVDRDLTFAEYWTDPDEIERWRKKCAKCAEVLVPDSVDPEHITGLYVSGEAGTQRVVALDIPEIPITIDGHLFFQ
jgi:hypothetical protein